MPTKPTPRAQKPKRETGPARNGGSGTLVVRGKNPLEESLAQFIPLYLGECRRNATATAIAMGANPRTAHQVGHRFLVAARASGALGVAAQALAQAVELKTQDILLEVKRIARSDPRRFYRDDGTLKAPDEWDDDMAAAVSSVKVTEIKTEIVTNGKKTTVVSGRTNELKFWNKVDALDKAMRHAGLFERDNRQRRDNLAIQINLVGAPPQPKTIGNGVAGQTNGKNGSHP